MTSLPRTSGEIRLRRQITRLLTPARAAAVLLFALAGAAAPAQTWEIDSDHTSAGFSVRHMMISTVRGSFRKVTGSTTGDPARPASLQLTATIDAGSIDTGIERRDHHLKSGDFFDVARFPTITFKSKTVVSAGSGKLTITGDLTMHGVTKEVVLQVEGPTPEVKDHDSVKIGASATATINRQDFGIAYDSTGLTVGNEIKITIDVELRKK